MLNDEDKKLLIEDIVKLYNQTVEDHVGSQIYDFEDDSYYDYLTVNEFNVESPNGLIILEFDDDYTTEEIIDDFESFFEVRTIEIHDVDLTQFRNRG